MPTKMGEHGAELAIKDYQKNTTHPLKQLSHGTRTQVLLAARIAFTNNISDHNNYPIILDEVLQSSDPSRIRAIIEALCALTNEGKQILYFSCRPEESIRWQELAAEFSVTDIAIHQLESASPSSSPLLVNPTRPQLPDPLEYSLEEYASHLKVPQLHRGITAHQIHVAHLCTSARQLHQFLTQGITHFGQLAALEAQQLLHHYTDELTFKKIKARAEVVYQSCNNLEIGRGKPLNKEIIVEVYRNGKFLDDIFQIIDTFDGDTNSVMEALDPERGKKLKGFRKTSYEKIKNELRQAGYYQEQKPLSKEESRIRVIRELSQELEAGYTTPEELNTIFQSVWSLYTDLP